MYNPDVPVRGPNKTIFADGTEFTVSEMFGQPIIDIFAPSAAQAPVGEEEGAPVVYSTTFYSLCFRAPAKPDSPMLIQLFWNKLTARKDVDGHIERRVDKYVVGNVKENDGSSLGEKARHMEFYEYGYTGVKDVSFDRGVLDYYMYPSTAIDPDHHTSTVTADDGIVTPFNLDCAIWCPKVDAGNTMDYKGDGMLYRPHTVNYILIEGWPEVSYDSGDFYYCDNSNTQAMKTPQEFYGDFTIDKLDQDNHVNPFSIMLSYQMADYNTESNSCWFNQDRFPPPFLDKECWLNWAQGYGWPDPAYYRGEFDIRNRGYCGFFFGGKDYIVRLEMEHPDGKLIETSLGSDLQPVNGMYNGTLLQGIAGWNHIRPIITGTDYAGSSGDAHFFYDDISIFRKKDNDMSKEWMEFSEQDKEEYVEYHVEGEGDAFNDVYGDKEMSLDRYGVYTLMGSPEHWNEIVLPKPQDLDSQPYPSWDPDFDLPKEIDFNAIDPKTHTFDDPDTYPKDTPVDSPNKKLGGVFVGGIPGEKSIQELRDSGFERFEPYDGELDKGAYRFSLYITSKGWNHIKDCLLTKKDRGQTDEEGNSIETYPQMTYVGSQVMPGIPGAPQYEHGYHITDIWDPEEINFLKPGGL